MKSPFQVIALAVSFGPSTAAMLAETMRLVTWFDASLVLIHVGEKEEAKTNAMQQLIASTALTESRIKTFWVTGDPADQVLKVCKLAKVDLLIAGALKKENLVNHYLGTVARKIMRKANCSIWMITDPSIELKPLKNVVVDAEGNSVSEETVSLACQVAGKEKGTWVHIVRELTLLGLALVAREQCSEAEYDDFQQKMVQEEITLVQKTLDKIPHSNIKVNIKVLSGKSGFELAQFAKRKLADLLIIKAPQRRFSLLDRIFTHDQEYIFSDLPCNLLVLQPKKKND